MTNLFLQSGSGQSGLPMLIMMVAIFAIMWLFMIRPQQKKQKKIREFQNALKEGDKVVTGGGIYGTVKRVNAQENTIDIGHKNMRDSCLTGTSHHLRQILCKLF